MKNKFVTILLDNKMILAIAAPTAFVMLVLILANICGSAFYQKPAGTPERMLSHAEKVFDQSAKRASGAAESVCGGMGWLVDKTFEAIEKVNQDPNGKD